MRRSFLLFLTLCLQVACSEESQEKALDLLLRKNADVESGNQSYADKEFKAALEKYEAAAKALPEAGGVALNQGLAFKQSEDSTKAYDRLEEALKQDLSGDDKASLYFALGNLRMQNAMAIAEGGDLKQAVSEAKGAVDALRRSLRQKAGQPDVAWNYELAKELLERLKEEKRKEDKEKDEQEKKDQEQEEKDDKQDQEGEDEEKENQGDEEGDDKEQPDKEGGEKKKPEEKPGDDEQKKKQPQPQEAPKERSEAERILDAQKQGEKSLSQERAAIHGKSQRRKVEKDW